MLLEWKDSTDSLCHYQDLYIALCNHTVCLNMLQKKFVKCELVRIWLEVKNIHSHLYCENFEYPFDGLLFISNTQTPVIIQTF